MPEAPARARRHDGRLRTSRVVANHRVTPAMARLTLAGDLDDWQDNGTDQHIAVYCLPDEPVVPDPASLDWIRAHWLELLPRLRRYTIRRHDPVARTVDVDMVLHGDGGPAAAFAAAARPGDRVVWWGPTAAYEPGDAAHHLLLADETGLPAVAAILEELPSGASVRAVVEVPDLADAQDDIAVRADADVRWLPRRGTPAGLSGALLDAVDELGVPDGCRVWAAGERAQMRAVRRRLLAAGVPRADVHVAAYWEHGVAQDAVPERRDRDRAAEMRRLRASGERADAAIVDDDDEHDDDHEDEHEDEHDDLEPSL